MPDNIIEKPEKKKSQVFAFIDSFLLENFKVALLVFTVLILVSGYFFILKPKYEKIKEQVSLANQAIENTSENLNAYLKGLNNYIKQYEQIDPLLQEKMGKVLPAGNNKEQMYIFLEKIAQDKNLFLISLEILDGNLKTGDKNVLAVPAELGVVSIEANFLGVDYFKLMSLLDTLEKSLQIIDVRSIAFDPKSSTVLISMNTYYLKVK